MDRVYQNQIALIQQGNLLLGKALIELYSLDELSPYLKQKGKGKFGNIVEALHYGIQNNNRSEPDVANLGIEIKTNPLVRRADGSFAPKEVVSLGMIDYTSIIDESFETSGFLRKNRKILYNMYWYETENQPIASYRFLLVDLVDLPEEDLKIIKKDWTIIKSKFESGQADSLSKSDTHYLAAGTKGGKNQQPKEYRSQKGLKFTKGRAFVFKSTYIKSLLEDYELTTLSNGQLGFIKSSGKEKFYLLSPQDNGDIKSAIESRFKHFIGKYDYEIANHFGEAEMFALKIDKGRWHWNTSLILTGKKKKNLSSHLEEFKKSGLTVKTIRVNSEYYPAEEVSFRTQDYLITEDSTWEESSLYFEMSKKFLWVIYRQSSIGCVLDRILFWSMPEEDLNTIRLKWEEYKAFILNADFRPSYFMNDECFYYMKIKDNKGGANKEFDGQKVTSLSHWMRRAYVQRILLLNGCLSIEEAIEILVGGWD